MNLENRIEVGSVSAFLDAVKQIYCDQDHQLFYRGVSKTQYATPEHDHPGIYRNKSWIDNEDKMFYELTAKCPEYFKDCKTTFEHLVMMQHYDYPTRLLDITSNPLVSLYFACGGKYGANSEDGQLISYHINKNDIRNYESDRISLLSTLSLSSSKLNYFNFMYISWRMFFSNHKKELEELKSYTAKDRENALSVKLGVSKGADQDILKSLFAFNKSLLDDSLSLDTVADILQEFLLNSLNRLHGFYDKDLDDQEINNLYISLVELSNHINNMRDSVDIKKFFSHLRFSNYAFDVSRINATDMRTIQCVLPKQNNPRLIAQQGAFLLFGFKDAASDKTATPIVPDEMYGKFETCIKDGNGQVIEKQQSSQKAEIIIKGSEKQKILDELKILGISNSTMFPEIDNIANELKSQYAKPR